MVYLKQDQKEIRASSMAAETLPAARQDVCVAREETEREVEWPSLTNFVRSRGGCGYASSAGLESESVAPAQSARGGKGEESEEEER
eukprot:882337-Pleurochrysis_carterae.AAC.1